MPDPGDATTAQELVGRLRAFKAWSGNPSLRELERRTGLPRSTISGDLSPQRSRLPPLQRVLTLATAFGASAEELARWRSAWQRLQMRQQSAEPPVPAPHVVVAPPASDPVPTTPEAAPQVRREPEREREPEPEPERTGHHRLTHRRLALPARSITGLLAAVLALPPIIMPVTSSNPAAAGNRAAPPAGARRPDRCGSLGRTGDPAAAPPRAGAVPATGESVLISRPVVKGPAWFC
ncbi:hypothetical protein ACFZB9_27125 [Kitasatospora sp. NPDC008050]|uniref:hypothetical protein n=1 Tax=Kitasatospora sp. NPDC008050 TaxID=3364021 RepID=UPI0036E2E20F